MRLGTVFLGQVKQCGEVLQRHTCRAVCHKYGNEGKCRFLFPHEVVDQSHFDVDSNSIVFVCRDPTINYFNPHILVFCRHNHDLKCILSGKSAKAAMFYISDYITKMDTKTYETLSLISHAVVRLPDDVPGQGVVAGAKMLLHKCLSQFNRQQQIHAQQAAHYVLGLGDSISSHSTVPMLSSVLIAYLKETIRCASGTQSNSLPDANDVSDDEDGEHDNEPEQVHFRVETDKQGRIVESNQVHNYLYHSASLADMSFYDFCRCVRLQTKARSKKNKNMHESHLGVLHRHELMAEHPLSDSHKLVEHTNEAHGECNREFIPRVVGMSIPRRTHTTQWALFALAHFKLFSDTRPLLPDGRSASEIYESFTFLARAKMVMHHWEAVHECEDEHDADRLRRRAQLSAPKKMVVNAFTIDDDDPDLVHVQSIGRSAQENFRVNQLILLLKQSRWLTSGDSRTSSHILTSDFTPSNEYLFEPLLTDCTARHLKQWNTEIRMQEAAIANTRHNALNPEDQVDSSFVQDTVTCDQATHNHIMSSRHCKATETLNTPSSPLSHAQVITQIGEQFNLNEKQWLAFHIVAEHFIEKYVEKRPTELSQIVMLMMGPGGTGKTHVVKAVCAVMEHYGQSHLIRFLAPTGSAAALIDGMTVHKGLGIKIKSLSKGKGNHAPGESLQDYSVIISNQNKTQL